MPYSLRKLPESLPQRHLLGLLLLALTEHGVSLGNNSLLLSLTGSLGLSTLGVHLLLKNTLTCLLSLGAVDLHAMSVRTILCELAK